MVHVLNVFWIPSVLAAWPAAWLLESVRARLGVEASESSVRFGFAGMLLIDTLTLILIFLSMRTLHRNAVEHRGESPWIAFLASPTSCLAIWLSVQPMVLAMLGWPPLLVHADEVAGSLVGKLLLSAAPTVLFLVILFDRLGWKYLLGNTLAIAMVVVACTVESMRWMLEMDLSTASLSSWWSRRADADVWSDSVWLCLTLVAAGAITSWVLPYWMIWVTGSGSMEPSFAEHIRGWWLRAGVKPPRVLLWPTGCRYSNAAIVQGLGGKRLLITDRLLLNYTMPQIEWIVLHEIAHVCRFHSWVRLIPAWIAVPSLLGALQAFEGWSLVAVILAIALVFGVLIMATCWWTEIDADRTAIRMGERWMGLSREAAAAQYVDVLRRIYRDNRLERTSWTHPSLEQRIAPYKTLASCGIP